MTDATGVSQITPVIASGVRLIVTRQLGDTDEARDAAQEILARAVAAERAGRFPADVPPAAFVHGIMRHVLADVLRNRRRDPAPLSDDVPTPGPSALEALVHREERDRVRRALAHLDSHDRELITRCFHDGERVVDIARASGEPPERIRKRKSRALAALRTLLRGHETPARPTLEA